MRLKPEQWKRFASGVYAIYRAQRIPIAAAGLAFYLTMTFFPLLICLQSMLGSLFPSTGELRALLSLALPRDSVDALVDYLGYVASNESTTMLVMALTVFASSSAAAYRTVDRVMGAMRGARRFGGGFSLAFSFCFSLVFLAAVYFSVVLVSTGKWFLEYADRHIYAVNISDSWRWWRFFLLFALLFALISSVYRITAPRGGHVRLLPGAAGATVCLVVFSMAFSAFIGAGAKYPLVYGSLAVVVVVMLWLYTCGIVLFLGAAVNVTLETLHVQAKPE